MPFKKYGKKIISCFLVICTLLCGNVFASDDYTIVNMAEFADVNNFSEGLCAVLDNNTQRWGFVDVNKNWVIAPQFQNASYFKNDVCAVNTIDGESVLINRNGEIIFKLREYDKWIESDKYFLEKHGKYKVIFEDMGKMVTRHWVTLVDDNYKPITPDGIILRTFIKTGDKSPDGSNTVFWEDGQKRVFNYKGIDITDKLTTENVKLSDDMTVNNKYIVGQADNKIKCFDIDGDKIAEFDYNNSSTIQLRNDIIIYNNNVYNIPSNKQVFDSTDINVESIEAYYNKFFTVKKENGTTALFTIDGKLLVDFGKWDNIYPSSISNKMVVVSTDKGGIADYDGNLLLPLEYGKHPLQNGLLTEDGKYAMLSKGGDNYYCVDMSTLKQDYHWTYSFEVGYKYHRRSNILNNNLETVFIFDSTNEFYDGSNLDIGVVKLYHDTKPRTYSFLIFNDSGIKVDLDSKRLEFDVLPVIIDGRTLVPMRTIFEALGATVEWDEKTQTITATGKDIAIKMQIGSNILSKNGQSTQLDVSPQLIDGRTMVPVRAVSDCFNVLVDWNGYTQTVSLFTN